MKLVEQSLNVTQNSLFFLQQQVIKKSCPVDVGAYTGEDKVDFWDQQKWNLELTKYQVGAYYVLFYYLCFSISSFWVDKSKPLKYVVIILFS
jgi:hypothetical protein